MEFKKACRLCGEYSNNAMHNVFDKDVNGQQIIQLIKQCLPILIYRTDPLSKHICTPCYSKLHEFGSFRNKAMQTNDRFKANLSNRLNDSDVRLYLNSLENAYENDNIQVGYYRTMLPVKNCASQVTIETKTVFTNTSVIKETDNDDKPTLTSLTVLTPKKINQLTATEFPQKQSIEVIEQPRKKRRIAGPKSKTRHLYSPEYESPNLNRIVPVLGNKSPGSRSPPHVYSPNINFNEYSSSSPHLLNIQKSECTSLSFNDSSSKFPNKKCSRNTISPGIIDIESPPTLLQFALKQINYNINISDSTEYKTDPDHMEYNINHNPDQSECNINRNPGHSDYINNSEYTEFESNTRSDSTIYNTEYNASVHSDNAEFHSSADNMEYATTTTNSGNTEFNKDASSVDTEYNINENSNNIEFNKNMVNSEYNSNINANINNSDNMALKNKSGNSELHINHLDNPEKPVNKSGNMEFNTNLDNAECNTSNANTGNLDNSTVNAGKTEFNHINSSNPQSNTNNTDNTIINMDDKTSSNTNKNEDGSILYQLLESNTGPTYQPTSFVTNVTGNNVLSSSFMNYDINLDEPAICNYCNRNFESILQLSKHELSHIKVDLGSKVDSKDQNNRVSSLYTDYLKRLIGAQAPESTPSETGTSSNDDESSAESLLIPANDTVHEFKVVNNIVLINDKPLKTMEKIERRKHFKDVMINGVKRKFCSVCRHTFKDNWAMENHFFSDVCQYTCKFCGRKFKFQKELFQAHLKLHEGEITNRIFGPRDRKMKGKKKKKFHTVRQIYINQALPPKVKPIKIKTLMQKKLSEAYPVQIKTEPGLEPSPACSLTVGPSSSKDDESYQAFFCRKCFKVFFKVDQYNTHVKLCTGENLMAKTSLDNKNLSHTSPSDTRMITRNLNSRIASQSKRPVRSCVKEININTDSDVDSGDNYPTKKSPSKSLKSSVQGFDCTVCCSSFPSKHSRNSHMRIHKGHVQSLKTPLNKVAPKSHAIAKVEPQKVIPNLMKGENNFNLNSTVARLVHNNPHLTIRSYTKAEKPDETSLQGPSIEIVKVDTSTSEQTFKKYKCADCNERFENKSVLYYHKVNSCVIKRHYECAFCRKKFGSYEHYHSHMLFVHPE